MFESDQKAHVVTNDAGSAEIISSRCRSSLQNEYRFISEDPAIEIF